MRIATYNVNSIHARLPSLTRWLQETAPDVVCLQELKTPQEKFPEAAVREAGYGVIWHGQKSYNGVAILTKGCEPVETRRVLPGDPERRLFAMRSVDGIPLDDEKWNALVKLGEKLGVGAAI